MGKTLIIAEKPSVGRDIGRVLGVNGKGDGFLHSEQYLISWAFGHLCALWEPEDYDPALKSWRAAELPILPQQIRIKPVKNTAAQLRLLAKLMKDKNTVSLICATDAGREGELIFRWIYEHAGCKKPVRRLWISSMTDAAIREGFANLRPLADYDNLYQSARCRSHADWLVGINATRAYTVAHKDLLSIGRVQTPTLAMIVARQREIDAFVPQDYWEVTADFAALTPRQNLALQDFADPLRKGVTPPRQRPELGGGVITGNYSGKWFDKNCKDKNSKIDSKEKAAQIAKAVRGKGGQVQSNLTEKSSKPHPLLYDLAQLQRDCNSKFGFSAAKTLGVAQDLYEKRKLITYPRTDSRHLSSDIRTEPVLAALMSNSEYAPFVAKIRASGPPPLTSRAVDNSKVTDHHAIIPTERMAPKSLTPDEIKVYDLIVRSFLACFYPPFVRDITEVVTAVEGELFLSKGAKVAQPGWAELFAQDKEDGELPPLSVDEPVLVEKASSKAKKTKPPKPYTEGTLISAMENAGDKDSGLGTAATRAGIIERLLKVGYIQRKGKNLVPTQKAVDLIQILPNEILSAETTGRWEKGLAAIAAGTMAPERFMGSIERFVRFLVEQACSN